MPIDAIPSRAIRTIGMTVRRAIDQVSHLARNVRHDRLDAGQAQLFGGASAGLGGFFNVRVVGGVEGAEVSDECQGPVDDGLCMSVICIWCGQGIAR